MEGLRQSVLSADGTRVGFVTGGAGPALLMVHGGMSTADAWEPLWPLLLDSFQVTAMDRRGRAGSGDGDQYSLGAEIDDVTAVIEHLSKQQGAPIDVFGHSFGAVCALGAAACRAPIHQLAVYEPPGPETVPVEWLDRMRYFISQGQSGRAMFSFLTEVVGHSQLEVEAMRDRTLGYDPLPIVERTLVREAEALSTADLSALAADVIRPVLMLLGSCSPPWAASVTQRVADVLPTSEVVLLQRQGHEAIDRTPDAVSQQLKRFFSTP